MFSAEKSDLLLLMLGMVILIKVLVSCLLIWEVVRWWWCVCLNLWGHKFA